MKLQQALREKEFAVVAVHAPVPDDAGRASVTRSMEEFGIRFPILLGDDAVEESYGITGVPTRVLLDSEGRVVFREAGFREEMAPELERRVREALK